MKSFTKSIIPLAVAIVIWILIATGVVSKCNGQSLGNLKTVYIKVVDSSQKGFPSDLAFTCYLMDASNEWTVSESHTQATQGFDYLIAGTDGEVHHIAIQCGNFQAFGWQEGDRLIVKAIGIIIPFSMILNETEEQYSTEDLVVPEIAPARNLRIQ